VSRQRAEKTVGDLREELGALKERHRIRVQELDQLNTAKTKRDVYISAGVSFAGLLSVPGTGPFGVAVAVVSAGYGAKSVVSHRRRARRLKREIRELDNDVLLKENTIRQARQGLQNPPQND